jgi:hypothetical protein
MKPLVFLVLLLGSAFAEPPALTLPKLVTVSGAEYQNVTVTQKQPDGIRIMHANGVARIKYTELPAEVQSALGGFDPKEIAEAKKRGEQQEREEAKAAAEADKEATKAAFMRWALDNTAVTDIAINGPSMFVTLKPEKYTTPENVTAIADTLARSYAMRSGLNFVACRVFRGKQEYAKGTFAR